MNQNAGHGRSHRRASGKFEPLEDRRMMAIGAEMVANLGLQELGSNAHDFVEAAGKTYFLADDGYQTGLWVTDGTADGTRKATELMPSPVVEFSDLVAADDRLFLLAGDPGLERARLWAVDPGQGTETEVALPEYNSFSEMIGLEHGVVIGLGVGGGWATWISDGTAAGTFELPTYGDATAFGQKVVSLDGVLYWRNLKFDGSVDIWRMDGSAAGSRVVASFASLDELPAANLFSADNEELYFANPSFEEKNGLQRLALETGEVNQVLGPNWTPLRFGQLGSTSVVAARNEVNEIWLWRVDGTSAELIEQLPSAITSNSIYLTEMGGALYFSASTQEDGDWLWRTDGTAEGTFAVASIASSPSESDLPIVATSDHLFIGRSIDLWVSDGTAAGTSLALRTLAPNPALTVVGGRAYFNMNDLETGSEPWTWSGNDASPLANINLSDDGVPASQRYAFDDHEGFYFAKRGFLTSQIWRADTETGAAQLMAEYPSGSAMTVREIAGVINGKLIFSGFQGMFAFDPATSSTASLLPSPQSVFLSWEMGVRDGLLYFGDGNGKVWTTDGTPNGTVAIAQAAELDAIWNVGNVTYFRSNRKLFASDGTVQGTILLVEDASLEGGGMQVVGFHGAVYFTSYKGLWKSDGTAAGTSLIIPITDASYLAAVNDRLLFVVHEDGVSRFWTSDGTVDGTAQLADAADFRGGWGTRPVVSLGDVAVFANSDDEHGGELWVSDGTAAGTKLLLDINPGPGGAVIRDFKVVRGVAFFSAYDPEHGIEPWMTDGTVAGTRRIADIKAGSGHSYPNGFVESAGHVYFFASDGMHGDEVWRVTSPQGDANFDGVVDLVDLNAVRNTFGALGETARGDVNGDGIVDAADLDAVRGDFGARSGSTREIQQRPGKGIVQTSGSTARAADAVFELLATAETKRSARRK